MNTPKPNLDTPRGFAFALAAYLLWGFLPLYMKALSHVPVAEVIAHRVVWSVPVAGAVLVWLGRTAELRAALRTPRMLGMGAVTAALITVNWGIYVWAIQSGHALEAALGYYINPLFSVFLGAVLLKERLSVAQWAAIGLAVLAVLVLTVEAGQVPVVALGLTLSWGAYAYFKKMLPIGPNQGFMLEVLILSPFALGYLLWRGTEGAVFTADALTITLLLAAGIVTAVPLMLYANGAKLLKLSTIGILQYTAPTMIFLTAVFLFDEPFGFARAIAFPMIWAALAIYTLALFRGK
ncbi:EamA family transporter RarD [Paragemmobacter straminiformis]|uniref:EamA family transporter RarD n=1 Tax=Paragemmobacter straminiformis TaxID=2045119 RepID=A0A842I6X8_9RHOB|nr:EamA family transporter RarD [Gemmobacter straminiformis]MBC2835832.1 EamA family transporter RarD [Gemmobacter straminiformis]